MYNDIKYKVHDNTYSKFRCTVYHEGGESF